MFGSFAGGRLTRSVLAWPWPSIQRDSEALRLRIAVAARAAAARRAMIVLVDPDFAYGREMVIEDALGRRTRVPYDAAEHARQVAERRAA
jgi:hypothetical protein